MIDRYIEEYTKNIKALDRKVKERKLFLASCAQVKMEKEEDRQVEESPLYYEVKRLIREDMALRGNSTKSTIKIEELESQLLSAQIDRQELKELRELKEALENIIESAVPNE